MITNKILTETGCDGCIHKNDYIYECHSCKRYYTDRYKSNLQTRQDKFLEMYPNAIIDKGNDTLIFYPCDVDVKIKGVEMFCSRKEKYDDCDACREVYWHEVIE